MKKLLHKKMIAGLILSVLVPLKISADVVINEENFPDENFRAYLLEQDYGSDGIITDMEIEYIYDINIEGRDIYTLKGIEYFTELHLLDCVYNQLTELDVSKNTVLNVLFCAYNQLTNLNVSKNKYLHELHCENNKITSLYVAKDGELEVIDCENNRLKGAFMNAFINSLPTRNTEDPTCSIYIYNTEWEEKWSDEEWWGDEGCPEQNVCTKSQVENIRAKGWLPLCIKEYYNPDYGYWTWDWIAYEGSADSNEDLEINEANFPDEGFRNYLLTEASIWVWDNEKLYEEEYKYGEDGIINKEEIENIKEIFIKDGHEIFSQKGIENFQYLSWLGVCNTQISELNLSANTALNKLYCERNENLTTLNVYCSNLSNIECYNNGLIKLDASNCHALETIYCNDNKLTELDVSDCTNLREIHCWGNQLQRESMDAFINSLPYNWNPWNYQKKYIYLLRENQYEEGNICTVEQVEAIREKGWIPLYERYDPESWWYEWAEYTADAASIPQLKAKDADDYAPVYDLTGKQIAPSMKDASMQGRKGIFIVNGNKVILK